MKRPTLVTARLALRPHERGRDVDRLLPILGDAEVMQHIGRGALTRKDVENYLDRHEAYWANDGLGGWTIERIIDGAIVGNIFMKRMSILPEIEVGYCLGRNFWNEGLGKEALSEVVRHAREDRGLSRLVAVVRAENFRSSALLRRCGFRVEGEREINGQVRDFFTIGWDRI